ncbi:hypothetical protein MTR_8g008643 [Medicago truncatula]|uniref:Uncharacterized protein n=1 Tax=Medicago truncatula TaxID=3880 RepID=A0A072TKC3_MEDTR|nr:hypothetical protein MTR_8g008643 [Medicago truncatula]
MKSLSMHGLLKLKTVDVEGIQELLTLFVNHLNLQLLYETLMERKGDDCLCSSSDTKCWWHGLKNVKVISSVKIDENIDFKTMLELLPNGEFFFSFILCDILLDGYVKNTPKKKNVSSKGSGKSKGDKRMQSQKSVTLEEGEHNVETHGPKTVIEDKEATIIVEDEAVTVVKE